MLSWIFFSTIFLKKNTKHLNNLDKRVKIVLI